MGPSGHRRWQLIVGITPGLIALACDSDPTTETTETTETTKTPPDAHVEAANEVADGAFDADPTDLVDPPDLATIADAAPDTLATCPAPPYGNAVGDTLADYTLYACDGAPVQLASVCARDVTYLNLFAGWCPPCNSHARVAPADYASLVASGGDVAWLFVITEDSTGAPADLAYCDAVRDGFDLPMTVLVDLEGRLPDHLGLGSPNSWYLVMSSGLKLEARVKYDKDDALEVARELAK